MMRTNSYVIYSQIQSEISLQFLFINIIFHSNPAKNFQLCSKNNKVFIEKYIKFKDYTS
jgi:hypothetical protein